MVLDLLNRVTSSCELLDVGTGNLTFVLLSWSHLLCPMDRFLKILLLA